MELTEPVINLRKYLVAFNFYHHYQQTVKRAINSLQMSDIISDFYSFFFLFSFLLLLVHFVLEASGYLYIWVLKIGVIQNWIALLKFLKLFSQILGS